MTGDWVSVVTLPEFQLKPPPLPCLRLIPRFHCRQPLFKVLIILNHFFLLRVHKPLLQNAAFVVSNLHSSLFFTLVKYFVRLCSFNQMSQIPLPITHSLCYLLLHICKSYRRKNGAAFNYVPAFVCSHNSEKLILAQKSKSGKMAYCFASPVQTLCLLFLPVSELRTLH